MTFLYAWPIFAKRYWAWWLDIISANSMTLSGFYVLHSIISGWIVSFTTQVGCALIYYLEWECFERYKVLEEPWPWKVLAPEVWWR